MFIKRLLKVFLIPRQPNTRSYFSSRIKTLFLENFDKYYTRINVKTGETFYQNQRITNLLEEFNQLSGNIKDVEKELNSDVKGDDELLSLMKEEKVELETKQNDLITRVLNEIYNYEIEKDTERITDASSILFEVSAGVGGREAMLFANELCMMYINYFNYKNWEMLDVESDEDQGCLRHFQAKIEGRNVWSHMKFEAGVHRVQRVPETEMRGRIHTSTVSIACIPITNDSAIVLNDKDLKIQTKTASGAGGQHVNKTESAIRITHVPSGVSVECQEDRSQIKNREIAMRKLQKILTDRFISETFEKTNKTRKSQVGRANRNEKIRTFNYNQDRITDHRLSTLNIVSNEKEDTIYDLEGFFKYPVRLDEFIGVLQKLEKERELLEIFNELNNKT